MSGELVRYDAGDSILSPREAIESAFRAGLLPATVKTLEAALVIAQKGRELGLQPMQAISGINVINGKPTLGAELIASLIYAAHGDESLIPEEWDETVCTMSYKRRGWKGHRQYTFSLESAKKAGLLTNPTWQKYPMAMLRSRCVSNIGRMAFPDVLAGMAVSDDVDEDPEPDALPVAPAYDAAYWRSRWFATVNGTPLDTDDARRRFLLDYTEGKYDSLKLFLADQNEDAPLLIAAVERTIQSRDYEVLADYEAAAVEPDGSQEIVRVIDAPTPTDLEQWAQGVRAKMTQAGTTTQGKMMAQTPDLKRIVRVLSSICGDDNANALKLLRDLTDRPIDVSRDLRAGEAEVWLGLIASADDRPMLDRYAQPQGAML